jgi:hypothetical protein
MDYVASLPQHSLDGAAARRPRRPRAREAASQSGHTRRKSRTGSARSPWQRRKASGQGGDPRMFDCAPRSEKGESNQGLERRRMRKAPAEAPDRAAVPWGPKHVRRTTHFPPQEGRGLGATACPTASPVETGAGSLPSKNL